MPNSTSDHRGQFIVFEGIDGSGKSTQVQLLADYLTLLGKKVFITREPSPGNIGQLIRKGLRKELVFTEATLAALFLADRIDHLEGQDGIWQMLEEGITVICDRYFWSSFSYHALGLPMEWVISIHQRIIDLYPPDVTIFLDIDVETSMKRIGTRGEETELFENRTTLTKVRNNYLKVFEKYADDHHIEVIKADRTVDEIKADISALF